MKLGKPDQSQEMALVSFEGGLERGAFGRVVCKEAARLREVHPKRGSGGVGTGCRLEMPVSGRRVVTAERVEAEHVVSDRMLRLEAERRLEVAKRLGAAALLLRPHRPCQVLLDSHAHHFKMRGDLPPGQGRACGRLRL